MAGGRVTLFLCGDVMLGRGVDQILPSPGDPTLHESCVKDAREYVRLAEAANGPIPRPVDHRWVWGDALEVLDAERPDVRILNLETSVTVSSDFMPGKGVHYRMSPANLPALAEARPDACVLANNHVMDFGRSGLEQTLDVLSDAGIRTAGAGHTLDEARRPATVALGGNRRVLVLAVGMASSGVPSSWAAAEDRPGVWFLPGPSSAGADEIRACLDGLRRPGDLVVVSLHWGGNWGYDVSDDQVRFAHQLVDGGVDVVHGHSSHHPRPIEVYHGKLVLYGCGDFVDDYEGIGGQERFRDELRLLYLASLEAETGRLASLRMVPVRARRMRLERASRGDAAWLQSTVDRISRPFGRQVGLQPDGVLTLGLA